MLWTQDVNPQVWRSGALYVAAAWENWVGLEGGFVGYIYEASKFPDDPVYLSGRWGRTPAAALTRAVKAFDPEAVLPSKKGVVS